MSRTSSGGAEGIRTPDPFHAMEVRYQLRHSPGSPERRSPGGDCGSLPRDPPVSPNRAAHAARALRRSGAGVPGLDAPAGLGLHDLGPMAVAEPAEHPPRREPVEVNQL